MQATRQRILEILKERNTATVEELAYDLGLTPVTIRHHLDILRSEGLVQAPQVKRRDTPGRPALLATTKKFLDDLGLRSVTELPPLEMMNQSLDLADAEPQYEST